MSDTSVYLKSEDSNIDLYLISYRPQVQSFIPSSDFTCYLLLITYYSLLKPFGLDRYCSELQETIQNHKSVWSPVIPSK